MLYEVITNTFKIYFTDNLMFMDFLRVDYLFSGICMFGDQIRSVVNQPEVLKISTFQHTKIA